jgi:hypothetical protein
MTTFDRRSFLGAAAGLATAAALAPTLSSAAIPTTRVPGKLVHQVYFWLKRPDSKEDLAKLLAGIRSLAAIETVRGLHVGVPASTEQREVVDNSFSASELLFFDSVEDEHAYQVHPIHAKFVEECSPLFAKVVVYDSVAV